MTPPKPLVGVSVVEFAAIGPVPFAAMLLADMGCDIVRIGRPGQALGPSASGPVMGRGRREVTLDLREAAGREAALAIIADSDILLEGYRPGVLERLGLGPEPCRAVNPRLVYGRLTGWGRSGPRAHTAGHDINYLALSGALHAIGPRDCPVPPLNLVADYAGGSMMLIAGVLAALVEAKATGRGQDVDVAMVDGVSTLMSLFQSMMRDGGWTDQREANLLDGGAPFYRCYRCNDGGHVAVGAIEPHFFAQLLMGLRIDGSGINQYDQASWPDLTEMFARHFATRSRDEWAQIFELTDACVTPVLSIAEAAPH